uniref:Uncharacterized protein n=1 Tax=Tetranychus urticae TaxID=32264 RepID=T1L4Q5_TETUR
MISYQVTNQVTLIIIAIVFILSTGNNVIVVQSTDKISLHGDILLGGIFPIHQKAN